MSVAYIGKITSLNEIDNADFLLQGEVVCGRGGKWSVVVRKGDFEAGDTCEVYLQDALLPEEDRFSFMESSGYRVRMMRLRGVPSEALVMPTTEKTEGLQVGEAIDHLVGVEKYRKPVPNSSGQIVGAFPTGVPKTGEPNFQTVPEMVEALQGKPYYVAEKADGTSATLFCIGGEVGICSRNWQVEAKPSNFYWAVASQYDVEALKEYAPIAVQFEIVGPGIQGNPLGLEKKEGRLFSVYFPDEHEYGGLLNVEGVSHLLGMPMVRVLDVGNSFDYTTDELRDVADGTYPNGRPREGIVVRPQEPMRVMGEALSFKVINLEYRD